VALFLAADAVETRALPQGRSKKIPLDGITGLSCKSCQKKLRAGRLWCCQPFFWPFFLENSLDAHLPTVYDTYITKLNRIVIVRGKKTGDRKQETEIYEESEADLDFLGKIRIIRTGFFAKQSQFPSGQNERKTNKDKGL